MALVPNGQFGGVDRLQVKVLQPSVLGFVSRETLCESHARLSSSQLPSGASPANQRREAELPSGQWHWLEQAPPGAAASLCGLTAIQSRCGQRQSPLE